MVLYLSSYKLSEYKESLLAHGLGFCPTMGPPEPGTIFLDLEDFKRRRRLPFFSNPENSGRTTNSPTPEEFFTHQSFFKNISSFNLAPPDQLESILHQIDSELHRHTYKAVRNKNFTQPEFKV